MRRSIIALAVLALVAAGATSVLAGGGQCSHPCGTTAQASAGSCGPSNASATACENPHGKVAGHFDATMSSVCRFACATKLKYQARDVIAQPGAMSGKLTQCPVSGVVFAVDRSRPHVRIDHEDYVTCCDKCATKLKRNPSHYLKA